MLMLSTYHSDWEFTIEERLPMSDQNNRQEYWKANLRLVAFCLSIWFVVSYLFGIILVDS